MADPTLSGVKERVENATPGPWCVKAEVDDRADVWGPLGPTVTPYILCDTIPVADAAFIAHARTDVPHLLALLDQALGERDEAVTRLREVVETITTRGRWTKRALGRARRFLASLDSQEGDAT